MIFLLVPLHSACLRPTPPFAKSLGKTAILPQRCPPESTEQPCCNNVRIIRGMLRHMASFALICSAAALLTPPLLSAQGRGAATPPPLFFKEPWQINGPAHAIAPGENVLTNANLELKLYGPSAT